MLTLNLKKLVADPIIWRRLHEERIGLHHVWFDRQTGRWFAYGLYPWLPDVDDAPHWAPEYDSRATLMQDGGSAQEAVLKLFDDPKRSRNGLGMRMFALECEFELLLRARRRGN